MDRRTIGSRPMPERLLVIVFVVLSCVTLAHAIYLGYSEYFAGLTSSHTGLSQPQYYALHNSIALTAEHPLFHGADHAPNQYRVGVEYLGRFMAQRLGVTKYYSVFSGIDLFCAVAVSLLCYAALVGSNFFLALTEPVRSLAVVLLLASLAYPFAWVVPYQRPETLPSALYLVTALGALARVRSRPRWLALLALATVWQSFVRTDIPAVLGIAVLLLGLTAAGTRIFGSRWRCFASGALLFGIAVTAQWYLQAIAYPHAVYPPDTKVIQLFANFSARRLIAFSAAMLPWVFLVALAARCKGRLDPEDMLAVTASCLYVPLWWTLGVIGEARLFVPFLLALTPTMSKAMVAFLSDEWRGRSATPPLR